MPRRTPDEDLLAELAEVISAKVLGEIRSDLQLHEQRVSADIEGMRQELEKHIGKLSEDGKGGTGLTGQLARTNERVDQLFNLKFAGVGFTLALSLTGAVLLLGLKTWLVELVHAGTSAISR